MLLLSERSIGGDLYCRNGTTEGSTASCSEENEMSAGYRESCGSNKVVSGSGKKIKSLSLNGVTVADDVLYCRCTALLCASERLVLKSGDTALLVSGRRILVYSLTVTDKVFLKIVDKPYSLVEKLNVFTAVHEKSLGTEHFGNFCEDRGASAVNEHIGEYTNGGVSGNTGKSVGSAALETYDKLGGGYVNSFVLRCDLNKLGEDLNTVYNLVLYVLTVEEAYSLGVNLAKYLLKLVKIVILTSETENENTARVGMVNEACKSLLSVQMVTAEL